MVIAHYDHKKRRSPRLALCSAKHSKAIATVRAAVTVGAAGHARETGVLVRSALESLINAAFIGKDDSELRAKPSFGEALFFSSTDYGASEEPGGTLPERIVLGVGSFER
jgi:hypothetical protein